METDYFWWITNGLLKRFTQKDAYDPIDNNYSIKNTGDLREFLSDKLTSNCESFSLKSDNLVKNNDQELEKQNSKIIQKNYNLEDLNYSKPITQPINIDKIEIYYKYSRLQKSNTHSNRNYYTNIFLNKNNISKEYENINSSQIINKNDVSSSEYREYNENYKEYENINGQENIDNMDSEYDDEDDDSCKNSKKLRSIITKPVLTNSKSMLIFYWNYNLYSFILI